MSAKYLRMLILGLAFAVSMLLPEMKAAADTPPDILGSYAISITPRQDGTLAMNYMLENYCTYSDWPGDQPYLQVGVPNRSFAISDWGPKEGKIKVVQAEPNGSLVQLNFDRGNLPKNGDCFDLNFSIVQSRMAYPDAGNGNITFKFTPAGWSFPIKVKTLTLTWALPDPSLVKLTEPAPTSKDEIAMTWQWDNPAMDYSGMFHDSTIKLAYNKSAFTLPVEPVTTTKSEDGNGGSVDMTCLTIIIIFVVLVVIVLIAYWIIEGPGGGDSGYSGSYSGGGDSGLSPGSSSSRSSGGRSSSGVYSSGPSSGSSRGSSGGGWGGSSGHSSSCACVSCACACACAGGGKVGCSRKGIGIQCLEKVIKDMEA